MNIIDIDKVKNLYSNLLTNMITQILCSECRKHYKEYKKIMIWIIFNLDASID
jgi:hypothetical protein